MNKSKYIWMDGKFVDWQEANIHILSHTLHYGNGVFEGTRAYKTDSGLAIFHLQKHTERLLNSAKVARLKPKFTQEQLQEAQKELLKINEINSNAYIRPIIYLGDGVMGLDSRKAPVKTAIATWGWGTYLGEEGLNNGIRIQVSSFVRNSIKSHFGKAKIVANYFNSQMAKIEACENGFDEALLLDEQGFIAEGSGECFFMLKNGTLITPYNENSLESITQSVVLEIAKDLNIPIIRRNITRDEIYMCDECFFTGTAAEVTPIREIDRLTIGNGSRGEITKQIQQQYFNIVYGREKSYYHYLTFI